MSEAAITGRAHSVRDRLRNLFKVEDVNFDLVLARYSQERFLYRLSISEYRDHLMLKGGLLFTAVTDRFGRATRDIDVLAKIDNDEAIYRQIMIRIIGIPVEDDGVQFDPESVVITRINVQDEEPGLRATFRGTLAGARLRGQIDAGFGDKVLLPEERFVYPSLLDDVPAAIVRAYSIESVIAEKFEAIASLGEASSRYKDYDDIVQLAKTREFRASNLYAAVMLTYSTRETDIARTPTALSENRATQQREVAWTSYRSKSHSRHALPTLSQTLEELRNFWAGIEAYRHDGVDRIWRESWSQLR